MTPRTLPLVGLVALGLLAAACSSDSTPTHAQALKVLTKSESAIEKQTSLRFVDVTRIKKQSETVNGQFGASSAEEVISTSNHNNLDIRLVDTTIYLKTNSTNFLMSSFSMTAAQAATAKNQWIMISSTDSTYSSIAQSLTITQAVGIYYPTKAKATLGNQVTINGVAASPLSGVTHPAKNATQTTTVNVAVSTSLPLTAKLTAEETGKPTETKEATFSKWGGAVSVVAPSSSTPLATFTS